MPTKHSRRDKTGRFVKRAIEKAASKPAPAPQPPAPPAPQPPAPPTKPSALERAVEKIEFSEVAKKAEEDEFKKDYSNRSKQDKTPPPGHQNTAGQGDQRGQGSESGPTGEKRNIEYGMFAEMIAQAFNDVGVPRGYEAIDDNQMRFLKQHTAAVEKKYLEHLELYPEVEAGLAHLIVYLPKVTRKMKRDRDANADGDKTKK